MKELASLQRGVQSWMLGTGQAVKRRVAGSREASAEQRLDVYRDAVRLRFQEVLDETFPALRRLVGEEDFVRLAGEYASAFPSSHPSIRWFGQHMELFLLGASPWCRQPLLAEMARFEWHKDVLVDAGDGPVLTIAHMAAIPAQQWAGMRPCFVPACRRVALRFNVPVLWRAIDAARALPPVRRDERPRRWLLWRKGAQVHWRSLDVVEAWAVERCDQGATFGDLCAGLCQRVGERDAPAHAAMLLKQWATDGILTAV